MFAKHKFSQILFSAIVIMTLTLSGFTPIEVSAQRGDNIKRQINP